MRWERFGIVAAAGVLVVLGGTYVGRDVMSRFQTSMPVEARVTPLDHGRVATMLPLVETADGDLSLVLGNVTEDMKIADNTSVGGYAAASGAAVSREASPRLPSPSPSPARASTDKPALAQEAPDGSCFIAFKAP